MATYTSKRLPLPLHETGTSFQRADLEFIGVDHSGPSYEGRVFLNAPEASADTPLELTAGYAGSFYIFGHPHCWGDVGHCDPPPGPLHGYDRRPPHQLVPERHVVDVTEAISGLIEGRGTTITVSVVPVMWERGRPREEPAVLQFERLSFVTYD
jgi:hypothetical protein